MNQLLMWYHKSDEQNPLTNPNKPATDVCTDEQNPVNNPNKSSTHSKLKAIQIKQSNAISKLLTAVFDGWKTNQ